MVRRKKFSQGCFQDKAEYNQWFVEGEFLSFAFEKTLGI